MATYVEEFTKIAQADSGLAVLTPIGESPYFQQSAASFSALAALGEPLIVTIVSPALGDTIRYDGTKWVNNSFLKNTGSLVSIGTDPGAPAVGTPKLRVEGGIRGGSAYIGEYPTSITYAMFQHVAASSPGDYALLQGDPTGDNHTFLNARTGASIKFRINNGDVAAIRVNGIICAPAALATTATGGFLYLPSCAGVPTGVPTSETGTVPCVVDTTNKRVYLYLSGAWFNLVGDSIPG